jgi:hypothetical protein
MKAVLLLLVILTGSILPLAAEDVIKDKSPDGKFALRMIHGKEGWVDRAEFEKGEAGWRDELDKKVAQIKDKPTQMAGRAGSTGDHLKNVRETWLPVYEPRKVEAEKHSQP